MDASILLEKASIFFCSNVLCGLIANLFKLPAIIGYMVSGIILGPFAIQYVHSEETMEIIHEVGYFGLLIFMFLTGVDLEISRFLKSGVFKHISFAFLQFVHSGLFVLTVLLLPRTAISFIVNHALIFSMLIGGCAILYLMYRQSIEEIIQKYVAVPTLTHGLILLTGLSFAAYIKMENVDLQHVINAKESFIFLQRLGLLVSVSCFINVCCRAFLKWYQFSSGFICKFVFLINLPIFIVALLLQNWKIIAAYKEEIAHAITNYLFPYSVFVTLLFIVFKQYDEEIKKIRINVLSFILGLGASYLIYNVHNSFLYTLCSSDVQIVVLIIALLALNSTAVALKLLEYRDQKENDLGTNVIGILISQDLMFMAVIIFLKSFKQGISVWNISYKLALAALILYAVNIVCQSKPSFVSDFLDYVKAAGTDLMTVFIITLCCVSALLFGLMGVSDVYGAFVAGLLMGNVYKHRYSILDLCDPIGALLMSIFFLYIGLLINMKALQKHYGIITLINIVVMVFKYFSNYMINQEINKHNTSNIPLYMTISSLILTQMSEFSLVMIDMVMANIDASSSSIVFGLQIEDAKNFLEILKSSSIVSLTFGCLFTVITKRIIYSKLLKPKV